MAFRLVGCQDLMEDVGSRVSKHDNLLTVVTYPPDYKSLPRRGRGTSKYRGSRDDQLPSKSQICLYGFVDLFQFLQGVSVAASPVLATIGMSVRPSVCHTLALSENDAS